MRQKKGVNGVAVDISPRSTRVSAAKQQFMVRLRARKRAKRPPGFIDDVVQLFVRFMRRERRAEGSGLEFVREKAHPKRPAAVFLLSYLEYVQKNVSPQSRASVYACARFHLASEFADEAYLTEEHNGCRYHPGAAPK